MVPLERVTKRRAEPQKLVVPRKPRPPKPVTTPTAAGTSTLSFDLVREGISWFQFLGSTPLRTAASVAAARAWS